MTTTDKTCCPLCHEEIDPVLDDLSDITHRTGEWCHISCVISDLERQLSASQSARESAEVNFAAAFADKQAAESALATMTSNAELERLAKEQAERDLASLREIVARLRQAMSDARRDLSSNYLGVGEVQKAGQMANAAATLDIALADTREAALASKEVANG